MDEIKERAVMSWLFFVLTQFVPALMGIVAFLMSARFIWFFRHSEKKIRFAMFAFLAENMVSAAGTLAFSFSALYSAAMSVPLENVNNVPPVVATIIRICMFSAMIHSTFRLSREVGRIVEQDRDKR